MKQQKTDKQIIAGIWPVHEIAEVRVVKCATNVMAIINMEQSN